MPQRANIPDAEWYDNEQAFWRSAEDLTVSEWAEKYRILAEPAEEKGPLRLRRTPYLRPILDACLDDDTEIIVFCKSAQIAGTEGVISIIGYYCHQEPCPIMFVLADEDTATYMSRERVQRMFTTSPELSKLVESQHYSLNKNEITLANGAYIAMGWASSVAKLASRPIKIIAFDEIDKPGYHVTTKEASPISLGIQRTETFFSRLILMLSTPTTDEGNIWRQLNSCDVIFDWHVPCLHCGQFQPLRWGPEYQTGFDEGLYYGDDGKQHKLGGVVWEGGRKATQEQIEGAMYACGECGGMWDTLQKNEAVEKGKPVARSEIQGKLKKKGFHSNRIYSLLGKSGDIPKLVDEWIRAVNSGDPKEIQGFVNSTLAEPWKQVILTTNESAILKARTDLPAQVVPQEAIGLTAGIDMQKYGFWFVVRAWARDYTSWLIDYGNVPEWDDIGRLLFETEYPVHEGTGTKKIMRAAIDTGGGELDTGLTMTEEAYFWIRQHGVGRGCRVFATKGSSRPLAGKIHPGKVLDRTPSGKPIPGGLQIILIDTDQAKDAFHYRLGQALEDGPQAAYLHKDTGEDYAKQILAEEKRRNEKGADEWVKVKRDNHLLDAEILCHVCAEPEWPGGGIHLYIQQAKPTQQQEAPKQRWITQQPTTRAGGWLKR